MCEGGEISIYLTLISGGQQKGECCECFFFFFLSLFLILLGIFSSISSDNFPVCERGTFAGVVPHRVFQNYRSVCITAKKIYVDIFFFDKAKFCSSLFSNNLTTNIKRKHLTDVSLN